MEDNQLAKTAIAAALKGNWEKAAELNKKILAENPQDSDALNRLAKACSELGNAEKAKNCYSQVLKFDPANAIAVKNLKLLTKSTNGKNGSQTNGQSGSKNLSLDIFLAEPGKTKLVNLINLATPSTLSQLTCGEKVEMVIKKHQVVIESSTGDHLGAIPDDLSHYLISLTSAGNNYEAYIKAVRTNVLTLMLWEKERAAKFANQPSFLARKEVKATKSTPTADGILDTEFDENFLE